jgi:hypothetical protein
MNLINDSRDWRYERKFILPASITLEEIEVIIKLHPSAFLKAHSPRVVNTLYYDSLSMDSYLDHISGSLNRFKLRVRWYGKTFGNVTSPVMEIKQKLNHLSRKSIFELKPFFLESVLPKSFAPHDLSKYNLPRAVFNIVGTSQGVLLMSYYRKYFVSADKKFRLTLDYNIKIYPVSGNRLMPCCNNFLHQQLIMEIKYFKKYESSAHLITSLFPFRIQRFSKYISGVEQIYS